jgi:cytochrome c-type biogenesis protein CcmH
VRALSVIALACVALALAPSAAGAAEARASLPDIEDEVMCLVCGTLLAESDSPQAVREKELIRNLIAQGQTKDQIEDRLVDEYGPRVLATPSGHGFDLLAWIVPIAGILLVAGALVAMSVRLRRRRDQRREPPPELDPEDAARLRDDLSAYDH